MLNPQITGKAERALGAILDRLLARTGTSFPQWAALAVTAAKGGSAGRDQLVAAIGDGKIPESAVLTAISELAAAGRVLTTVASRASAELASE